MFLFTNEVKANTAISTYNKSQIFMKQENENFRVRQSFEGEEKEQENALAKVKNPCAKLKAPLKFVGYIVLIIKIIIPLILIIFGMMDLLKAVTAGKDGELMKSVKSFAFRVGAGVLIFFVPTIISFVFGMVDTWTDVEEDYNVCQTCILNVTKCDEVAAEKEEAEKKKQEEEAKKENIFQFV